MIQKITPLLLTLLLLAKFSFAQDAQFSQFYANPMYTNPSFAGSDGDFRLNLNYRNQWPSAENSFTTYNFSADYYIDGIDSGIGLMYTRDEASAANLRSQSVALQYAYEIGLSDEMNLRFGLQGSFTSRDINFSNLIFADQWNNATGAFSNPTSEVLADNVLNYVDVAAGMMWYTHHYWAGLSVYNLTRPNQDFLELQGGGTADARLPVRYSMQFGVRIPIERYHWREKYRQTGHFERDITITAHYRHQGSFDQLDIGAYLNYPPVVFGLWYRGIPVKEYEIGIANHEALVGLVGVRIHDLTIGYSYDYTISALGADYSGGAHELSISLGIMPRYSAGHRARKHRTIPCPSF